MSQSTVPTIERMQESHLQQVFSLIDRENWGWEFAEIRLIHMLDPGSSVVALDSGEVVGLVTCVDYGSHAFIVHVIAKEGWRGRRVGARMMRSVLADLDSRGVTAVELHANPEAALFYEQFSFRRVEEVAYFSKDPPHGGPSSSSGGGRFSFLPSPLAATSVATPLATATGYLPGDVERGLSRLPAHQVLARGGGGRPTAMLLSRTGQDLNGMGPWFMEDPSQAEAEMMMREMLGAVPAKRTDLMVPGANTVARAALASCGFSVAKEGIVRLVRSSGPFEPFPASVLAAGHLGLI